MDLEAVCRTSDKGEREIQRNMPRDGSITFGDLLGKLDVLLVEGDKVRALGSVFRRA